MRFSKEAMSWPKSGSETRKRKASRRQSGLRMKPPRGNDKPKNVTLRRKWLSNEARSRVGEDFVPGFSRRSTEFPSGARNEVTTVTTRAGGQGACAGVQFEPEYVRVFT